MLINSWAEYSHGNDFDCHSWFLSSDKVEENQYWFYLWPFCLSPDGQREVSGPSQPSTAGHGAVPRHLRICVRRSVSMSARLQGDPEA